MAKMSYDECKLIASQYSTRLEFYDNAPLAYRVACHTKWIDDFYPITYTTCKDSAGNYNSKTDFFKGDRIAYYVSVHNGWIDEFFPNGKRKPITLDELKRLARKYPTCNQLRKADNAAYNRAFDAGWLDIIYPDRRKCRSLTFNMCKRIAAKFRTTTEFRAGDKTAYEKSRKMGWLEKMNIEMTDGSYIYEEEDIINTGAKYTSLRDFRTHHKKMCYAAEKRGLLEKMPWLVKTSKGREGEPVSCIYVYEFVSTHMAYVGLTITKLLRDNDHRQPGDSVYEYAKAIGVAVPKPKYIYDKITIKASQILEQTVMDSYKKDGWALLNKRPGGSLGNLNIKLTEEYCIGLARNYTYITDFDKDHHSVWQKMRANGWDKKCKWLKRKAVERGTWLHISEDAAHKLAKKFTTRSKFDHAYRRLYVICLKNGWVDKWFPPTNRTSKPKPVEAYKLDGITLVGRYESIHAAARIYGCSHDHINNVCKGVYSKACGLIWKYSMTA